MCRDREYTYAKKGVTRHKLPRRRRDRSIEHLSGSKSSIFKFLHAECHLFILFSLFFIHDIYND